MHVFISYAKKDSRELAAMLEAKISSLPNFTAWMDNELMPAASWAIQIEQEIDRCDYFLVLISPDVNRPKSETQDNSFVLNEIAYAQAQRKPIIVAMASQTKLPIMIADEQYIDFTQNHEQGIEKLLAYFTGSQSTPQSRPVPEAIEISKTVTVGSNLNINSNMNIPASSRPFAWLNKGGMIGTVLGVVIALLGIFNPNPDLPPMSPLDTVIGSAAFLAMGLLLGQSLEWLRQRFFVKKA